jgi:Xaa-Pro aminopeptidase
VGEPTAPQRALYERWRAAYEAVAERCRPGSTPHDLRAAWIGCGEPPPPLPVVHGVGIGVEAPVVRALPDGPPLDDEPLREGMVLAVTGYVWERGVGGYLGKETVLVTDGAPRRLTRLAHEPLDTLDQ